MLFLLELLKISPTFFFLFHFFLQKEKNKRREGNPEINMGMNTFRISEFFNKFQILA